MSSSTARQTQVSIGTAPAHHPSFCCVQRTRPCVEVKDVVAVNARVDVAVVARTREAPQPSSPRHRKERLTLRARMHPCTA